MSVIQKIRNKYIGLVIGAIVIALIGFLVMDAMQSNVSSMFGTDRTLMGEVNGTRIDYAQYDALKNKYEQNLKSRAKEGVLTEQDRTQAQTQAWDDMVSDVLMGEEMEKLGLDLTENELRDILTGPYADDMVQQNFKDPNTGIFDPSRVTQFINSLGQDKTGQQREQWKDFEQAVIRSRKINKYNALITKGIYIPTFVMEQTEKLNGSKASLSYVQIPYGNISDSTIKINDADITDYVSKHAKMFKSNDAFAKVEYVAYDIIPSKEDSAASLGVLLGFKDSFTRANDLEEFVANNSEEALTDKYYTDKNLEVPNPQEVIAAPIGAVVGPVYMNSVYKMIKVIGKKSLADSAKASHILVAINEQKTEEQAKATIDSFETMVKSGMSLASIATARSDDKGSAAKGGDLGYFGQGQMVPEFDNACFNGAVGDLTKVKSQFGWHLIKVVDLKAFKPAVKLAIMSKTLQAGTATTQSAFTKANELMSKSKDAKSFTDAAKAAGKDKRVADYITPTAQDIKGIGNSRELSRWAFEAKIGAVSPVYSLDDKCVVATLVSRQEKGALPTAETVRPQVEGMLIKEKKAKLIIAQYKGKSTLEEIAAMAKTTVSLDSLNYTGGGNPAIANELKVIGASFNKAWVNKVSPGIDGDQGVYFIKVNSVIEGTVQKNNPMMPMMKQQMGSQYAQSAPQMIPYVLKQKAKITDNRANFF